MLAKKPPMENLVVLPAFPLGVVVFPGEEFYLHIFEQRYKQLIEEAHREGTTFCIPYFDKGKTHEFGVIVRVKTIFSVYPSGEMDIAIEGTEIFNFSNMIEPDSDLLYSKALIEIIKSPLADEAELLALRPLLLEYLQLKKGEPVKLALKRPSSSFDAAGLLNLPTEKKYLLITLNSESQRIKWLINELKILLQSRKMELQLNDNFYLN
jgi:uncharacterized protein